mmetsp:Transcript_6387/g.12424  ORF Transcript_6387/g.12424 Transcript_6387/m.12424 type:complete len:211 (-) Transcript_6387:187-819(-)
MMKRELMGGDGRGSHRDFSSANSYTSSTYQRVQNGRNSDVANLYKSYDNNNNNGSTTAAVADKTPTRLSPKSYNPALSYDGLSDGRSLGGVDSIASGGGAAGKTVTNLANKNSSATTTNPRTAIKPVALESVFPKSNDDNANGGSLAGQSNRLITASHASSLTGNGGNNSSRHSSNNNPFGEQPAQQMPFHVGYGVVAKLESTKALKANR